MTAIGRGTATDGDGDKYWDNFVLTSDKLDSKWQNMFTEFVICHGGLCGRKMGQIFLTIYIIIHIFKSLLFSLVMLHSCWCPPGSIFTLRISSRKRWRREHGSLCLEMHRLSCLHQEYIVIKSQAENYVSRRELFLLPSWWNLYSIDQACQWSWEVICIIVTSLHCSMLALQPNAAPGLVVDACRSLILPALLLLHIVGLFSICFIYRNLINGQVMVKIPRIIISQSNCILCKPNNP